MVLERCSCVHVIDLRVGGSSPGLCHVFFLGQETLLYTISSPRCLNGYQRQNAGGNPVMEGWGEGEWQYS